MSDVEGKPWNKRRFDYIVKLILDGEIDGILEFRQGMVYQLSILDYHDKKYDEKLAQWERIEKIKGICKKIERKEK